MKLVFLSGTLGEGGAERVTILLANRFAAKGHSVTILVFRKIDKTYELLPTVRVEYLPVKDNKICDVISKVHYLRKRIRSINPEFVISLGLIRFIGISGLLKNYKWILSERNAPHMLDKSKLDWKNKIYCFEKAYRVVFQTEEAKQFYNETIQSKSIVIPNPVSQNLPRVKPEERKKRIVAFSRLTEQKNIPMMLECFREFNKIHPDYILDIYGQGNLRDEMIRYAEKLGISQNTHFMGFSSKIHEDISNAAMFISTSDFEGISNSMLEAMAMGLPVICTDCPVGGARMFIHNKENGMLSPVRDNKAFVNAMCFLAENPDEAIRIGTNAIEINQILSEDKIVQQWERLLR